MGVRYNAEKKKVGNYYTTPIYRFRMKCHLCDNHFEIETDPKNCDYVIVSGARRKEERWEPSATETVELTDKEDVKKMAVDAMFKLEHGVQDQQKSKKALPTLAQLKEVQSVWDDDYAANQLLRKKFREQKQDLIAVAMKDKELQKRGALDVNLLPEREEDIEHAHKIRYHGKGFDGHRRKRRSEINDRPLFDTQGKLEEKRQKITQLLGKRRQLKVNSFSTPPKSKNELTIQGTLGIKVRRTRLSNDESSDNSTNKDPSIDDLSNSPTVNQTVVSSELGSQRDPELAVNVSSETELPVTSLPDVTSQSVSLKQTQNCLTNQPKQEETHGTPDGSTEDSALISSSSISSLVCCDYADSSDASDDHT